MNTLRKLGFILATAWCGVAAQIQERNVSAPPPDRSKAIRPVAPQLVIPANSQLTPEIRSMVEEYQGEARKFAIQQRALLSRIRDSDETDRATLREQIRTNRERFLEDTRQLRADIREQTRKLRAKLRERPAH